MLTIIIIEIFEMIKSRSGKLGHVMTTILFLLTHLLLQSKAEEGSIMQLATVPTALSYVSPDGNVFINGSFKSSIGTDS